MRSYGENLNIRCIFRGLWFYIVEMDSSSREKNDRMQPAKKELKKYPWIEWFEPFESCFLILRFDFICRGDLMLISWIKNRSYYLKIFQLRKFSRFFESFFNRIGEKQKNWINHFVQFLNSIKKKRIFKQTILPELNS